MSDSQELQGYFQDLLENFKRISKLHYSVDNKEKSIFQDSLTWEIYTLLRISGIKHDSKTITEVLTNKNVSQEEVEKRLNDLMNAKVVVKDKGAFKTSDIIFKHSSEVRDVYLMALKRSIEYLQNNNQEKNDSEHFDSFCLVSNEQDFNKIKKILDETKNKIAQIVKESHTKERICYYNSNLFWASKKVKK